MEFKALILNFYQIEKKDKKFNIVRLYLNFSDVVISCFVSKDIYEKIQNSIIDNDNINEYLHFKVDCNMKFSCYIY